jgi:hypothetical protein
LRICIYGRCSCHQARARASVHSPAHAQPARASSRLPALGKRSAGALARQRRSAPCHALMSDVPRCQNWPLRRLLVQVVDISRPRPEAFR